MPDYLDVRVQAFFYATTCKNLHMKDEVRKMQADYLRRVKAFKGRKNTPNPKSKG